MEGCVISHQKSLHITTDCNNLAGRIVKKGTGAAIRAVLAWNEEMPKQEAKRAKTEEEATSSEEESSDDELDALDNEDEIGSDDQFLVVDQEGGESGSDDDEDMDEDDEFGSDDELGSDDEIGSDDEQESGESDSDDDKGGNDGEKETMVSSKKVVKVKSKDAGEGPKKKDKKTKKGNFNPDTSMYVTCRSFGAFTGEALQKYIAEKGFTVKTVYKHPPRNRFAFVDFGTAEEGQRALKELSGIDCKGSKIIVDIIKSADVIERSKTNLDSQRKPPTSSLTNRFLFVKNISPQFVSRKTLKDIFTKSESIIFPSQKGGTLREALVIFPKESQLDDAIQMFQGSEIGGHKLCLERLTAVPAESVEGDDTTNGEKESTKEDKVSIKKEKKSPEEKVSIKKEKKSPKKEKRSVEPPKKKKKLQNKN